VAQEKGPQEYIANHFGFTKEHFGLKQTGTLEFPEEEHLSDTQYSNSRREEDLANCKELIIQT